MNFRRLAETLINHNADVNATDRTGKTSLHLAAKFCNTEIAEALVKAKADPNRRDAKGRTALAIANE